MMSNRNTKLPPNLVQNEGIISWFRALRHSLAESNQRAIVLMSGARDWCLQQVEIAAVQHMIWLSNDQAIEQAIAFSKAGNLLGQEADCVLLDLYSGLNTDVLCMAAGLVRAGGMLLLISPPDIAINDDPYGCWQGAATSRADFMSYLMEQWSGQDNFFHIEPDKALPEMADLPSSSEVCFTRGLTGEQLQIMLQLQSWKQDAAQPFALVTADRGRGKSTLLGKFANSLQSGGKVIVSAASRRQVTILLQQLDQASDVVFMAPDEIIRSQQDIDVLLIDEVAMLPASVLQQCIERAKKTLMATTTGGYEGTGQGFLLKFMAGFNPQQVLSMQLRQAVRWGQNDLLEQGMNDALLLASTEPRSLQGFENLKFRQVNRSELNSDRRLLREIYRLLVSAHYRTRPSDLRQLMEDENQLLLLAQDKTAVLAVLLLNREGGFDKALSEQVMMGRRRPQGHLLAQMMTAQAGARYFACYRGYRVLRIAVEQNYRRRGLGKKLIQMASDLVKEHQLDYLGSSFALDPVNALFWNSCGFELVHLASGLGKSSGRQTVVVLKSEEQALIDEIQLLHNKLRLTMPVLLLTYANDMYWKDVLALLQLANFSDESTSHDTEIIRAFAYGFYGLDYALPALQHFIVSSTACLLQLERNAQRLVVEKLLLNYDWINVITRSELAGKKALLQNLRDNIRIMYEYSNTPGI